MNEDLLNCEMLKYANVAANNNFPDTIIIFKISDDFGEKKRKEADLAF